ncbi:MAG TPA: hypothetical protein VEB21_11070 [Terriglobales bacterium]|nr:hypothetical protein [Terriglobales bacterium]
MRTTIIALVVLLGLSTPAVHAFEGTLKWRTMSGMIASLAPLGAKAEDPQTVLALASDKVAGMPGVTTSQFDLLIKGSKVKERPQGNAAYVVVDGATGQIWMINPASKRYVEWSQEDRDMLQKRLTDLEKKQEEKIATMTGPERDQAQQRLDEQRAAARAQGDLENLGKQETIAGFVTTLWQVKVPGRLAHAAIATEPADLAQTFRGVYAARAKMQGKTGLQPRDLKEIVSEKGIPVRIVSVQGSAFKIDEIVASEPGPISDTEVRIPAGFEKTSLQDYLKGALQQRLQQSMPKTLPGAPTTPAK